MKYQSAVIIIIGGLLLARSAFAADGLLSSEMNNARTKPVGQVNIAAPAPSAPVTTAMAVVPKADAGKTIYESKCIICHGTGVAGAPKFGDAAAWQPHISKGIAVLFDHVLHGFNAMPPKGTCVECSDADLHSAMDYMMSHSK